MNAGEPAGSEEVRFEDLDLVYIIPSDLGAPIEAKDLKELLEQFSKRCKMVEGIWISPEEAGPTLRFVRRKAKELGIKDAEEIDIEELMKNKSLMEEINRAHAMFGAILLADKSAFNLEYLKLGRFVRVKLTDLNISIKDEELSYLNDLKCELYLLLHSAGIAVLTAWIHLSGNFSTDDVIKIEKELYEAECTIKDPFGNIIEGTLDGFVEQGIVKPLHALVLFKGEYGSYDKAFDALKRGDITEDKIKGKLRTPYFPIHRVVCIRKHSCNYRCETAEEAVERHLREIAGISGVHGDWRYYCKDAAKKELGENLSPDVDYAMFVTTHVTFLFLGSTILDERLKSEEGKELAYRLRELTLVQPMEFLSLSDMILDVYTSVYRNKFEEIRERRRRGETVKPSEIAEIREGLMDGLEEYRNVSLFRVDPLEESWSKGRKN
ncbi:MAG: hypothetical protein DSO07_09620 [Thermoproteota archaeon]|jgi:hypothetical protein|uniref:Uncharacterized protein n=1 Tax=Candidatus Methanodesulfokora washburnensis TaxID=2478471 RepID=A0A3R9PKQ2_9CREN|nr:hypothetical protein [Candidatus Methanodesulfokores washburnensis]RSN76657.1 hypothetical protein D6D85_03780 [Candidatus Methanodesulfokores washburnensis]TDA40195.1 MAG: hypothetical protein DSO07_09620 [Candidatus Korarchaeota archaeon]